MLKNYQTFKGGYRFGNYEGQPRVSCLDLEIPHQVLIPLRQGFGKEVRPLVRIGQEVLAGEIIGRDDENVSSPVHASVSGTVVDIKRMNYFKRDVAMVIIDTKPTGGYERLSGYSTDWQRLDNAQLETLIYLSGVSSLDREGIPTRFKSSIIAPQDVNSIIVHAVGSEPYNISLDVLLAGKNLLRLIEGVRILKKIMPHAKVYLALNSHRRRTLEEIYKLTAKFEWLDIIPLEPKYPQGYDEMLVPTLLNKKFPFGYSAANIGVVVLNTQAVLAVFDAVTEGKPLIERIVALCGPSVENSLHLRVRVGTPLKDILKNRLREQVSSRVVLNSLLTGVELNDFSLPIDRTFSQLIALPENRDREMFSFLWPGLRRDSYSRTFGAKLLPMIKKRVDTNTHGEERPCISCNYCEEVCPVAIIPHLLSKYVRCNIIDETLMNYQIFHCIECGLCSFVCPSKIPLTKYIKEGQDKLIMQGCDRTQCILPYFDLKGIEEYRGVTKL